MKNLIAITLIYLALPLYSQVKEKNIELTKGKIEDAKIQVDNNIKNPEKNQKAETWYLASYVYTRMAKSEVYHNLEAYPGEKALEYMRKSINIDADRELYSEQINVLLDLGPAFYNKAINNYNEALKNKNTEKYQLALRYFEDYFDLLLVLKDDEKFVKQIIELSGVNHNDIYFYSGYSAEKVGDINKALIYYGKLSDFKSNPAEARKNSKDLAFLYSSKIYESQKDFDNAIKIIRRGVELYPENENLVMTAIKIYKEADKMDEMVLQMESVVNNNPNNGKLLFLLAKNYSKYGKKFAKNGYQSTSDTYYSTAISYYNKALNIDTNNDKFQYSVNYNLGVLYYTRGAHEYKKGDKVDLNKLQDYFTKAKPILLKAKKLKENPNIDKMISTINNTLGE